MKRTLFTALIIAASVCTASAQDAKATATSNATTVKENDQKATEAKQAQWQNLVTELKLTDDQQKKIAEMNKAFDERQQNMENNPAYTEEFKAERRVVLKKARETQLLKLLTPEQQARYKEIMAAKSN